MKINYEILNYLNLISESLGDLYLKGKYNPFPDDFVMSEEMIKERLTLSEKQTTFPEFLYDDKEEITKHIKNFIKNIKNAENYLKNNKKMQKNMKNRLFLYFNCYFTLAENILKNMKKSDFEEEKAFNELLNIDPILSELLENFYELDIDISVILDKIEDDYYKLFEESSIKYNELLNSISDIEKNGKMNKVLFDKYDMQFRFYLEDNLNTIGLLNLLYELIKDTNVNGITKLNLINAWDKVLCLNLVN